MKKLTEDQQHMALLKEYGLGHYSKDDFGMKIGDHKLIVAVMNQRDESQRKELLADISEVFAQYSSKLETIIDNQDSMVSKIDELYAIGKDNRGRIQVLEGSIEIHNNILKGQSNILNSHNVIIKSLKKQKLWSRLIWLALSVGISIGIFLLLYRYIL